MRGSIMLPILACTALVLGACGRAVEGPKGEGARGRYAGVGLYPAGQMWAQVAHQDNADPAVAKLSDDEQIIVSIDSRTGELRQCGNVSGYCVGMTPWSGPLPTGQRAPVQVLKHAGDLARETAAPAVR